MEGYAYFPAIVYRDEKPEWVAKLNDLAAPYLHEAKKENGHPVPLLLQTNSMGKDFDLTFFSQYILESVVSLLKEQGYDVDKYSFYLQAMWAQESSKGGDTNIHVHKNSQMCGWMFLDVPENGAFPIFYDTRSCKEMVELDFVQGEEISNATNTVFFNNMKPGTVLFANSWLRHQLASGNSEEKTRALHFIVSHKEK